MDCKKLKKNSIERILNYYNQNISDFVLIIEDMEKRNLDPTKYYAGPNTELINLYELVKDFEAQKNSDIDETRKEIDEKCLNDEEELLQGLVTYYTEAILAKYTKGLSLLLPKHMKHIDVKEILDGKPLGGENSLLNKLRDDIIVGLGIDKDSDFYKGLKDPLKHPGKLIPKKLPKLRIKVRVRIKVSF